LFCWVVVFFFPSFFLLFSQQKPPQQAAARRLLIHLNSQILGRRMQVGRSLFEVVEGTFTWWSQKNDIKEFMGGEQVSQGLLFFSDKDGKELKLTELVENLPVVVNPPQATQECNHYYSRNWDSDSDVLASELWLNVRPPVVEFQDMEKRVICKSEVVAHDAEIRSVFTGAYLKAFGYAPCLLE
jgi:hypothetical protein